MWPPAFGVSIETQTQTQTPNIINYRYKFHLSNKFVFSEKFTHIFFNEIFDF